MPKKKVNKKGLAGEFVPRLDQTENGKWQPVIVSKIGRIQLYGMEYKYEKQARLALTRMVNHIRAMPKLDPNDIDIRREYAAS